MRGGRSCHSDKFYRWGSSKWLISNQNGQLPAQFQTCVLGHFFFFFLRAIRRDSLPPLDRLPPHKRSEGQAQRSFGAADMDWKRLRLRGGTFQKRPYPTEQCVANLLPRQQLCPFVQGTTQKKKKKTTITKEKVVKLRHTSWCGDNFANGYLMIAFHVLPI